MKLIEVKNGKVVGANQVDIALTSKDLERALDRGLIPIPDDAPIYGLTHRLVDADVLAAALVAYAQSNDVAALKTAVYGALGEKEVVRQPIIPLRAFLQRWTRLEKIAIEEAAEAQTTEGRAIRVGWRELIAGPDVDLDHPDLVAGLTEIAPVLVVAGVWKDETVAAQRIAEIRA